MKFKSYYILFLLLLFSFGNSFFIGNLQLNINNHSIIKSIVIINNLTSIFGPISYLILILLGSKFMFFYYDIKIKNSEILSIILKSLYPILFVLIFVFSIIILNYSSLKSLKTIEAINNYEIFFNLSILELKILYNLSWLFLYPLFSIGIMEKTKLSFTKSLVISILPSLLFFIIKFIISYV